MGYDYEKTHSLILKSAYEHFLKEGFRKASIRKICEDAGVTNGAFYAHFDSKEDLFRKLVEPDLNGLSDLYGRESSRYADINSADDIISAFKLTFESDEILVHYIYEHADTFRLILSAADGTEYEGFTGMLTKQEKAETAAFFDRCRPYVKKPENLSDIILEKISAFVVTTIFDCFADGKTEEETLHETQLASEFCLAGLKEIWGI